MNAASDSSVLLTVRGKLIPATAEDARVLPKKTAGSAPGIAAARSFGDLSHKVFTPVAGPMSSAKPGELLFLDIWDNPKGIMDFFSNTHVQQQAGKLFSARDASLWMPALASFSYRLPMPAGKTTQVVGIIRGQVKSPEAAAETFRATGSKTQRDARRRGILSHEVFFKMNAPGDSSPTELLALDFWSDGQGMAEHYRDPTTMDGLMGTFAGAPDASIWEQAPGAWSEW